MFGVSRPPVYSEADSFVFKKWFDQVHNLLNAFIELTTTTVSYTIETNIHYVRADATAGAITITLPTASKNRGRTVMIKKIDASVNAVTIARTGTDTIEGSTSMSLASQWDKQTLVSNGINAWEKL